MGRAGPCEPSRPQVVHAFLLDRLEVTNAEYGTCVEAGVCPVSPYVLPREEPDVPALVPSAGAVIYCTWRGARLPTDVEWDSATRGGENRNFSWGNQPLEWCGEVTRPWCGTRVAIGRGIRDVTIEGVHDLTGSVDEWVADSGGDDVPQVRGWSRSEGTQVDQTWNGVRCARDIVFPD